MFAAYAIDNQEGTTGEDGVGFLRVRATKQEAVEAVLRDLHEALAEEYDATEPCVWADVVAYLGLLGQPLPEHSSWHGVFYGHAVHCCEAE